MPDVLIVCAHRPERSPSQRYRFEQYLPFLEEHGYRFTWSYLLDEKDDKAFYASGRLLRKLWIIAKGKLKRQRDARRFKQFDIIFIQREASFLGHTYFEKRAFESGAHVIFDFDDSIWLTDTSPGNLRWEWAKRPAKFHTNVKLAHTVIAGNAYLAERARVNNRHVTVIPTTVDTQIHVPMPTLRGTDIVTIGWSGSLSTLKHFSLLLPVLGSLKAKYGSRIRFRMLGVSHYRSHLPDLTLIPWTPENEVEELNKFDIGIMPLPQDEWSLGKCGLKALTYMACGVPAVVSAIGTNKEIVTHGENGFLANTNEEWQAMLSRLIEDRDLRESIGKAGRRTVEEHYSVTANRNKYLDVFEAAVKKKVVL